MQRPKIKITVTKLDWLLEILALSFLVLHITYVVINYNQLPQKIPTHFNASGVVDGYGSRSTIFLLLGIAFIIYILLTVLAKYPHIHNFPVNITEENAKFHYGNSVKLLRVLKLIVQILFFYISYSTIQVAFGAAKTISSSILFLIIGLVFCVVGYFLYKTFTHKEKS